MAYAKETTNDSLLTENAFQLYLNTHQDAMLLLKDAKADCEGGTMWVWSLLADCLVRTEQLIGLYCGLLAIPLWCSAHIMLCVTSWTSPLRRRTLQVVCCPHLAADLCNLCGALLSYQFSSQILFAFSVLLVNLVICILHLLSIKSDARETSCIGEEYRRKEKRKVTDLKQQSGQKLLLKYPRICAVTCLLFFMAVDVLKTLVLVCIRRVHTYHSGILEIAGMSLGLISSLIYCLTRLTHLSISISHMTFDILATILTILADSLYLVGVYTQGMTSQVVVHTTPWSVGRAGLLGINTGVSFTIQLFLHLVCHAILQYVLVRWRRKAEVETREEQHSLLSCTTSESCEGSDRREDTLIKENTLSIPTSTFNNEVDKADEGKRYKPEATISANHCHVTSTSGRNIPRRQMTGCYSSGTSVTITNDADIESDLNCQAHVYENWRARMMSERRSSFTLKLSQLETVTCHDRVIQWFEKSTPEDEQPVGFDFKS